MSETMTKTEELLARKERFNRVERTTDAYGRVIGVRLLKISQRIRIEEMAPGLSGNDEVVDSEGKSFFVPKLARLIFAASVSEIDQLPYPFPKNRAELDALIDALDEAGIAAAAEGFAKLSAGDKPEGAPSVEDSAKNS